MKMDTKTAFWFWAALGTVNVLHAIALLFTGPWWMLIYVGLLIAWCLFAVWVLSVGYHHPERIGLEPRK